MRPNFQISFAPVAAHGKRAARYASLPEDAAESPSLRLTPDAAKLKV
jgi:hypothetical protein